MKIQDYHNFYEVVIDACLKAIEEKAHQFSATEVCLKRRGNIEKNIFHHYQVKRDFIRCNYMTKKSEVALDRHKVASCMIYAILKAKPFKVNLMVNDLPEEILMANEYLAFFVAINIVEMYRIQVFDESNFLENVQPYRNSEIIIPKTYHEMVDPSNTYESSFCRSLYYLSIDNVNRYDVFAYANILFLLEKYTDVYAELYPYKAEN